MGVINSNPVEVNESLSKLNLEEIDDLNQRNRIRSAYRKLVYFIRDNGIGFDHTTAKQLFTPFHRLDNAKKFQGTVLVLAWQLSKASFIDTMGGFGRKPSKIWELLFTLPWDFSDFLAIPRL